jgi:hypothetical protein
MPALNKPRIDCRDYFDHFDGPSVCSWREKRSTISFAPVESVFLLYQGPHRQNMRIGIWISDAHEADVDSRPADTTKIYFRKAVRTFALASRPLFRLTGRNQRILINV